MAGSDDSSDLPEETPPEVPEEFAAAYREAYLRALQDEVDGAPDPAAAVALPEPILGAEPGRGAHAGPDVVAAEEAAALEGIASGKHRVTEYRSATPYDRARSRGWFVPLLAFLAVLLVVLLAWVLVHAGDDDEPTPGAGPTSTGSSTTPAGTSTPAEPKPQRYRGPITPVGIAKVAATCTMDPGEDAAGRTVTYDAAHVIDGEPGTAWRCDGDAIGERLVLRLPAGTRVGALGLVAGYAKDDPRTGADRYAENNRITKVRWTLGRGTSFVQRLDGSPEDRALQLRRIPVTETGRVVLEVLEVVEGERGSTAISEISVQRPR